MLGSLETTPVLDRPDLVAAPVAAALRASSGLAAVTTVAEIDPAYADTATFCAHYGVRLADSANCVVVAARRGGATALVACVVLATTRTDVNGVVRRRLDARKASFAAMDDAVAASGMAYGGITPIGLPDGWPVLVDRAVTATPLVIIGSGLRQSKLVLPGAALAGLPGAEVVDRLGRVVADEP